MATGAQWRRLVLSMPGAVEGEHQGHADFRVKGKIFAGLSPDGKRATLKLTTEMQAMMLGELSGCFSACAGAWGRAGWTYVDLADVDVGSLEDLVREAWCLVAPKTLVREHTGTCSSPPAAEKKSSRKRAKKTPPKKPTR